MKVPFVAILALSLTVSAALAHDASPLAAGKPAGVRQAQLENGNGMVIVAGAALAGIAIALATAPGDATQAAATSPGSSTSATGTTP